MAATRVYRYGIWLMFGLAVTVMHGHIHPLLTSAPWPPSGFTNPGSPV
jgi:hypothetical protein